MLSVAITTFSTHDPWSGKAAVQREVALGADLRGEALASPRGEQTARAGGVGVGEQRRAAVSASEATSPGAARYRAAPGTSSMSATPPVSVATHRLARRHRLGDDERLLLHCGRKDQRVVLAQQLRDVACGSRGTPPGPQPRRAARPRRRCGPSPTTVSVASCGQYAGVQRVRAGPAGPCVPPEARRTPGLRTGPAGGFGVTERHAVVDVRHPVRSARAAGRAGTGPSRGAGTTVRSTRRGRRRRRAASTALRVGRRARCAAHRGTTARPRRPARRGRCARPGTGVADRRSPVPTRRS